MPSVFISYAHRDKSWLERLQVHLKPLGDLARPWDDTKIRPGDRWPAEIDAAIDEAKVVILLVSADFLASDFIRRKELPDLLKEGRVEGDGDPPGDRRAACLFEETGEHLGLPVGQLPLVAAPVDERLRPESGLGRRRAARPRDRRGPGRPPPAQVPTISTTPAAAVGTRYALIIDVTRFDDPFYADLAGPVPETGELAKVLADPKVGGFSVTSLVNESSERIQDALTTFFDARRPQDTVLLDMCGLAVKDSEFGLHYVVTDSARDDLETMIPGYFFRNLVRKTAARLELIVSDCRYAGAFPQGGVNGELMVGPLTGLAGEGRFALSATNRLSWAWEKDGTGEPAALREPNPLLLDDLIHGLKTGRADKDKNLIITVREMFEYLVEVAVSRNPDIHPEDRPSRWAFDQSKGDEFVIGQARLPSEEKAPTPRPKPAHGRSGHPTADPRPDLPVLASSTPRYYLLDWNEAFDEVVAKPLKLARGSMHAGVFVRALKNCEEVVAHSNARFGDDTPLVDTEEMVFDTSKYGGPYGQVCFRKIAAQITSESGSTLGWSVNLNVKSVEIDEEGFWAAILKRIESQVGWSRHTPVVYDKAPPRIRRLSRPGESRRRSDRAPPGGHHAKRCIDLERRDDGQRRPPPARPRGRPRRPPRGLGRGHQRDDAPPPPREAGGRGRRLRQPADHLQGQRHPPRRIPRLLVRRRDHDQRPLCDRRPRRMPAQYQPDPQGRGNPLALDVASRHGRRPAFRRLAGRPGAEESPRRQIPGAGGHRPRTPQGARDDDPQRHDRGHGPPARGGRVPDRGEAA